MSEIRGKLKKQFRLFDVYRCAITDEMSLIEGIFYYEVNREATVINVRYHGEICSHRYEARSEEELKEVIKCINKRLGNCSTPGPKRTKIRKQMRFKV